MKKYKLELVNNRTNGTVNCDLPQFKETYTFAQSQIIIRDVCVKLAKDDDDESLLCFEASQNEIGKPLPIYFNEFGLNVSILLTNLSNNQVFFEKYKHKSGFSYKYNYPFMDAKKTLKTPAFTVSWFFRYKYNLGNDNAYYLRLVAIDNCEPNL